MAEKLLRLDSTDMPPLPGASIVTTAPGSVTLAVIGEVDTFGTPVLDAAVNVVWDDAPCQVVVDLTKATFLSVSALHVLLRARSTARRRGVDLSLTAGSHHILRLLQFAGLGDVTRPCDGVDGVDGGGGEALAGRPLRRGPRRGSLGLVSDHVTRRGADPRGQRWPATVDSENALLRTVRSAAAWSATDNLQSSLESVCAAATATIPGAEGAGVLLLPTGHHGVESRAGTDWRSGALDAVGHRLPWTASPGLVADSSWTDQAVVVDDLASDPRWPDLAARVEELRVRSVLCLTLGASRPLGVLMLYSSRVAAFTCESRRLARVLAAVATIALPAAQRQHNLARALTTRDVIGQAKGILMERHKVTAEQAFLLLSRASSVRNMKLWQLAEDVAGTGEL
jgi:anti-anti-sigma factor